MLSYSDAAGSPCHTLCTSFHELVAREFPLENDGTILESAIARLDRNRGGIVLIGVHR